MVNSGGITHGTMVDYGGAQYLMDSSTAYSTVVKNQGSMYINGNTTFGGLTAVRAGGNLIFDSSNPYFINQIDQNSKINMIGGSIILNSGTTLGIMHSVNMLVYGRGNIVFNIGNPIINMGSPVQSVNSITFNDILGNYTLFARADSSVTDFLDRYDNILTINNNMYSFQPIANIELADNGIALGLREYVLDEIPSSMMTTYSLIDSNKYASYVRALQNVGLGVYTMASNLGNSMHKRVGELMWQYDNHLTGVDNLIYSNDNLNSNGFWVRNNIKSIKLDRGRGTDLDFKTDLYILEMGYDYMVYNNSNYGRGYVGILGQVASGSPELNPLTGASTFIDMDSKSIGLYAMWLGKGGYFADAVIREHFIDQDVDTISSVGVNVFDYKLKQLATTINLEFGREIVWGGKGKMYKLDPLANLKYNLIHVKNVDETQKILGKSRNAIKYYEDLVNERGELLARSRSKNQGEKPNVTTPTIVNSQYFLTPTLQFDINYVGGDSVSTHLGRIKIDDSTGYTLSVGFMLGKRLDINKIKGSALAGNLTLENNIRSQIYVRANYLYEFDSEVDTYFAGIKQSSDNKGSRGEVGLGFDAQFNKMFSIYIDGSYQFNSDYSNLGLNIGGRWGF